MKICCIHERGDASANFQRSSKSSKHLLRTCSKTKCFRCKKLYKTEEKFHESYLKIKKKSVIFAFFPLKKTLKDILIQYIKLMIMSEKTAQNRIYVICN